MKKRIVEGILKVLLFFFILVAISLIAKMTTAKAECLGGYSKILSTFYINGGQLYTEEDLSLLSEVMFHENGSNSDTCLLYTGSVVLNRVEDKEYPDSIKDVLYQKGQYATVPRFFTKRIPKHIEDLAKELLIFGSKLPKGYVYQAMFPQGKHKGEAIKVDTEWFCKK